MILILGSEGSMGKRYQAILKYLKVPFYKNDIKDPQPYFDKMDIFTGVIIATPTDDHINTLRILSQYSVPILCEKPLSKNQLDLEAIKGMVNRGMNLTLMMQYKILQDQSSKGESYYDYFRHGNDGLAWDCFQIIALAKDKITLKEESPIWKCELNGKTLSLSDMDAAYITYVQNWIKNPGQSIDEIINYHEKVTKWASQHISL